MSILPPIYLFSRFYCWLSFLPMSVSTHLPGFFISFGETIYFNNKYIRYFSSHRLSQVLQRNGNVIYACKLGYYKLLLYYQTQLMWQLSAAATGYDAHISDNVVSRSTYQNPRSALIYADYSYEQLHRQYTGRQ